MYKVRTTILFAAKSVFALITLIMAVVIIHEGAHYVSAVIMNIPVRYSAHFDINYVSWILFSGAREYSTRAIIGSYVGGLFTGLAFLVPLVLKRNVFKKSPFLWMIGLYLATLGCWQVGQGIIEGAFSDINFWC